MWYPFRMVISATEFKAKCLQLLDRVFQTGERISITKRGKVIAELAPPESERRQYAKAGFARDELTILGDILEPLDVQWDAHR